MTDDHWSFLRELRTQGILAEVNPAAHKCTTGFVAEFCSDCDRDIWLKESAVHQRIFPLLHAGGPLRIAPGSPCCDGQDFVFEDIPLAFDRRFPATGPLTIVLVNHFPCGKATDSGITTAAEIIRLLVAAKDYLRDRLQRERPDLAARVQIIPKFHVLWNNGVQRTYFLDVAKWRAAFG